MTEVQSQALTEAIAAEDPTAISIESNRLTGDKCDFLELEFTLRIGPIETDEGGLKFRDRERFVTRVPRDFPFRRPEVWVPHTRFAGFPHVQWSCYLCLYQASAEWNASDGVFGLIDRLWKWIENAAKNTLDPYDGPLHPPAIYLPGGDSPELVVEANAPSEAGVFWVGWAQAVSRGLAYVITGWHKLLDKAASAAYVDGLKFPAVLLSEGLPWEFPSRGKDLLEEIEKQGGDRNWFLTLLTIASLAQQEGHPVVVLVGTPMRRGHAGERRLHFSAWKLSDETAESLRTSVPEDSDTDELIQIREKLAQNSLTIFELSKIAWCRVHENRDEIVLRRDGRSSSRNWRGKRVALFGCGALGSLTAEILVRAGCASLVLVDNDTVTPGVLVRQNYRSGDIGKAKVDALKERLLEVRPDVEVVSLRRNAFSVAADPSQLANIDIIIDTTASNLLHQQMEGKWLELHCTGSAYVAVEIDATATGCWAVLLSANSEVGPWSAFREAKLLLSRSPSTQGFLSRFERDPDRPPFQPEPGCSEPTFEGSSADLMALASAAVNHVAEWIADKSNTGQIFAFDRTRGKVTDNKMERQVRRSMAHLSVIVSESAITDICANIRKHSRENDPLEETGGLLWGQWDSAAKVFWISDASDAPADSSRTPELFICGTQGTSEEHQARMHVSSGACGFIGMWHTHPSSPPQQSTVDIGGMLSMLVGHKEKRRRLLLLIVGKEGDSTVLGLYAYQRSFHDNYEHVDIAPQFIELDNLSWK